MFRSLPERDAQRVAAALKALKARAPRDDTHGGAVDAQGFLEARANGYRVLYRLDSSALKVALLNRIDQARVREHPKPKL